MLRIIKHQQGIPLRGEVREFYRQLAQYTGSDFADGGSPIFLLKLPSGQKLTILLGNNVNDLHRNLDRLVELLTCANLIPPSPYPNQHVIP